MKFDGEKTEILEVKYLGYESFVKVEVPTDEYVKFLEERVELLAKRLRQTNNKLNSYHQAAARQYRHDQDYLSYPDEDRDRE
jgi:hypothetical protein